MAGENSIEASFEDVRKNLSIGLNDFVKSIDEMTNGANELNKIFGQSNQRVAELMNTVADATPGILKLGGSMADVNSTIQSISEETGRNIAASAEDVSKLYATSQVVGTTVSTLVRNFADIGVQFPQIGKQLEGSVNYIQNLGLSLHTGSFSTNLYNSLNKTIFRAFHS
jgi:methyl-accepting chemotaxis protein